MTGAPLYLDLLALAFASARLSVLLVHDNILDAPRDWLFRRFPPTDDPYTGTTYQQRDKTGRALPDGTLRDSAWLGDLLACTRCTSVWTTAALAGAYVSGVPHVKDVVAALAVMGLASILAKKV